LDEPGAAPPDHSDTWSNEKYGQRDHGQGSGGINIKAKERQRVDHDISFPEPNGAFQFRVEREYMRGGGDYQQQQKRKDREERSLEKSSSKTRSTAKLHGKTVLGGIWVTGGTLFCIHNSWIEPEKVPAGSHVSKSLCLDNESKKQRAPWKIEKIRGKNETHNSGKNRRQYFWSRRDAEKVR